MKGLIITNGYFSNESTKNQVERLTEEFNKLGVLLTEQKGNEVITYIENGVVKSNIGEVDFVIFLDKNIHVAKMLEKAGYKVFNSAKSIELCDDKMLTYLELLNSGIKVPKTISAPLCFTKDSRVSKESVDSIISVLSLPLIAKKSFSSLGKGVYLIKTAEELEDFINKNPFEPKIYQEFISSSYGKDVRIICIGKKFYSAMLRYSDDDFRSNSALGGNAKQIDPPREFIEVAEKVASILNLDYMGIDLLFGKDGEPVLCEVNSNAYFTVMDEVCGVNVAAKYAEYIVDNIKNLKEKLWFQIALKI